MIKKIFIMMMIVSAALFVGCTSTETKKDEVIVTDFDSCVEAGNPVTRSYPAQCSHDGETYVEEIKDKDYLCQTNGGKWIESAKECEGISKTTCDELEGTFLECESACRNNPEAQVCTMQCVQVCKFQ